MTLPLRIAVVCYPALGGSGVIASELALGLAGRGHRVILVATELPERLRATAVRFERMRSVPCSTFMSTPLGSRPIMAAGKPASPSSTSKPTPASST